MSRTAFGRAADDAHVFRPYPVGLPAWSTDISLADGLPDLYGTVPATIGVVDTGSYAHGSEALTRGHPVRSRAGGPKPRPIVSVRDLAAELDLINAQIHRIMFQVERAVARLVTG